MRYNVGDMVRYSFFITEPDGEQNEVETMGLVVRAGNHNALVLLCGQHKSGWIHEEYIEVIHESR